MTPVELQRIERLEFVLTTLLACFTFVAEEFTRADVSNPPTTDQLLDKFIEAGHIIAESLSDVITGGTQ